MPGLRTGRQRRSSRRHRATSEERACHAQRQLRTVALGHEVRRRIRGHALDEYPAELRRRPGDAVGGIVRAVRPDRARGQCELDPQRPVGWGDPDHGAGVGEGLHADPRDVTEAVGVDGGGPSASCTSRLCAHVSISRAVTNDGGRIPRPHGTRICGSNVDSTSRSATWVRIHHCQHVGASLMPAASHADQREVLRRRGHCSATSASARGPSMQVSTASSSVSARCATVSRTSQLQAGVGRNQSSGSIRSSTATSASCSAARSSTSSAVASSGMSRSGAASGAGRAEHDRDLGRVADRRRARREPLVQVLGDHLEQRVAAHLAQLRLEAPVHRRRARRTRRAPRCTTTRTRRRLHPNRGGRTR